MKMLVRALGLIGALTLGAAPRLAHADEDPKMLARRHFDRGMELAGEGAYSEALVEFTRAHEISPHYAVLYNIGQAYVALGRPVEAVDALTRYLDQGGSEIPAERRKQVDAEILKQKARIAEVEVRTDVPGAVVSIDGKQIGRTPLAGPVRLAIGTHRIVAAVPGRPSVEQSVTVAGEERRRVELAIPAAAAAPSLAPAAPAQAAPAAPATRESGSGDVQRTLGFVAGAIGIGLGGATIAHYFWNKNRYDDWSAENEQLEDAKDDEDYEDRLAANNELSESIDRASVVTAGLGIGAGVILGTGIVLVVTAPGESGDRQGFVTWQGVW
jgi:tetratricopeptide (TPR) repeat protein